MSRNRFSSVLTLAAAAMATLVLAITCAGTARAQTTLTGTANGPGGSDDNWNNAANWTAGIPSGTMAAVINNGLFAQVDDSSGSATTYNGGLTLGVGSRLQIGWTTNYATNINALGTGTITMNNGSEIIARAGLGTYIFNQPFVLNGGSAILWGGISTANHHTTKTLAGGISGAGQLTYNGVNNTTLVLNTNNSSWSGGFQTADPQSQRHQVIASANGTFGTGDVAINNNASLRLSSGLSDVIDNGAALFLSGVKSSTSGWNAKLDLLSSETISAFWVNGVQQMPATYSSASGLTDAAGNPLISGSGTLTVTGGSGVVFWDINGAAAGAGGATPAGTWNAANTYWNAAADGTGSTAAWTAGRMAVFAAGTDATGTYTVTVSGTQDIGGLSFEEGAVTLSGGTLRMTTDTPVSVASGQTATIATTISNDATARQLSKGGSGTLVLAGANTYTGVTAVGGGILSVSSLANAGSSSNLGAFPTAGAGGLVLAGGTLQYTGGTAAIDRGFTLASSSTIDISTAGTALTLGACKSSDSSSPGTLTVTGGAGSSLALGELRLVQGIGMTLNPTVGGMSVASVVGDTRYGLPAPTLTLSGTTTGNVITGAITHINTHPSGWDPSLNVALSGAGAWTLSGTSTYTGTTTVNGGTLIAGTNAPNNANGAFGRATSEVTLGAAGGNTDAAILIGGPYTVGRSIRLPTSNTTDTGTRVLTLGGNTAATSTFSGNIILGTNNQAGRGITLTAATGGQVTFSGAIQDPTGMDPTTYAVMKAGAGTVVLSGNNTYSGLTDVQEGTLSLARVGGTIADASPVQVGGGTLAVAQSDTVGAVTLSSGTISGAGTLTGSSYALTDTGLISVDLGANAATLTKTGSGTATLAGVNAYTGATTVNAGTLRVDGSIAASFMTTVNGGTLSGNGTVGPLALQGGTVSPGSSVGVLAAANTVLTDTSSYVFEIDDANGTAGATGGPGWDLLDIAGTLDLSGLSTGGFTVDIHTLLPGGGTSPGAMANFLDSGSYSWEFVRSSGGLVGAFDAGDFLLDTSGITNAFTGAFGVSNVGNSLYVTYTGVVIPEPSTFVLAALALLGLAWYSRRRRRH